MPQQFHRAIVVGGSSGIGRELVLQLAAAGCQVASVARRSEPLGANVRTYCHDVTDFDAIPALFQQICLELGGLDLIVYASGVMPAVGPDELGLSTKLVIAAAVEDDLVRDISLDHTLLGFWFGHMMIRDDQCGVAGHS